MSTARKLLTASAIAIAALGAAMVAPMARRRARYPYGRRHPCLKNIGISLHIYASDHAGRFPSGQATPEGSLGLLYPKYLGDPGFFPGKTMPTALAEAILATNGILTPESCGWHYIEGLRTDDPSDLPLMWDKVPGYDHSGAHRHDGGREVLFVAGYVKWIPGDKWDALLATNRSRMPERARNYPP